MDEKSRRYLDRLMKLYYNVSNTNNMKNNNKSDYIVHSNIMELIMLYIRNNMILAEPSAPYILGENSQINNTHDKIFSRRWKNMLACLEMIEKEEKRKARQAKLNERKAKKEGMEIGEKRGEIRKTTQIAQKLLSKNFSITENIDITGLSKEEVKKLIQA